MATAKTATTPARAQTAAPAEKSPQQLAMDAQAPGTVGGGVSGHRPTIFIIQILYQGFPTEVQVEGDSQRFQTAINKLKEIGAQPNSAFGPASNSKAPAQNQDQERPRQQQGQRRNYDEKPRWAEGPPDCPRHGKELRESKKPGTYFCPSRDRQSRNGYCQYTWSEEEG